MYVVATTVQVQIPSIPTIFFAFDGSLFLNLTSFLEFGLFFNWKGSVLCFQIFLKLWIEIFRIFWLTWPRFQNDTKYFCTNTSVQNTKKSFNHFRNLANFSTVESNFCYFSPIFRYSPDEIKFFGCKLMKCISKKTVWKCSWIFAAKNWCTKIAEFSCIFANFTLLAYDWSFQQRTQLKSVQTHWISKNWSKFQKFLLKNGVFTHSDWKKSGSRMKNLHR